MSREPPAYVARMARADGCPRCVLNTETPQDTEPTPDGFRALYRCADCGHVWHTSWRDE